MSERILLCLAHMSGKEMDFIKEAFDQNWVVPLGPNVNGFEKDLEEFVNGREGAAPLDKKVVALSAGTAAVHLALIACGVKAGDEVIVQSFTFCASSHPVTYLGATPVFVDSEKDTWNMDPELLEEAIKDRIAKTAANLRLSCRWRSMACRTISQKSWRLPIATKFLLLRMLQRVSAHASTVRCSVHSVNMACCRSTATR